MHHFSLHLIPSSLDEGYPVQAEGQEKLIFYLKAYIMEGVSGWGREGLEPERKDEVASPFSSALVFSVPMSNQPGTSDAGYLTINL